MISSTIQKAIGSLNPAQKKLYESPETARSVITFAERQKLEGDKLTRLSEVIEAYLLDLGKPNLSMAADELGINQADLSNFLENLAGKSPSEPQETATESVLSVAPNIPPTTADEPTQDTPPSPAPDQAAAAVQPLRTMKEDVKRIHGYGAYRELYPNTPATETEEPTYQSTQSDLLQTTTKTKPPAAASDSKTSSTTPSTEPPPKQE